MLNGFAFLQIQTLILQCVLMIIFLGVVKPYRNPLFNKLEIFNELCIIATSYHLFLFTDYVPDKAL